MDAKKNIPSNASTSPGPLVPENILILLYFSVNNELVDNWMDRLVWTRDGEENEDGRAVSGGRR